MYESCERTNELRHVGSSCGLTFGRTRDSRKEGKKERKRRLIQIHLMPVTKPGAGYIYTNVRYGETSNLRAKVS